MKPDPDRVAIDAATASQGGPAASTGKRPERQSYLSKLSEKQYKAATHPPTHSLQILAGPGSGKTRVLTSRVAWLILDPTNRLHPEDIVVVTFTNKAANEMKSRLNALIGPGRTSNLIIGTFHATCARYLRKYGGMIQLSNNFSIVDADDSKKMIKGILKELDKDLKADSLVIKPEEAMSQISKAKAKDIDPETFRASALKSSASSSQKTQNPKRSRGGPGDYKLAIAVIYEKYQAQLREANALDFDDLLVFGVRLFRENPQIARNIQHVLVDEFQDTNTAQYMLMSLIASSCRSISVVGDPDQSIYGWRSAEVGNLEKMCKEFKGTEQIRLEENYRSTSAILEAALKVVQQDRARVEKGLHTAHPRGPPVTLRLNSSGPKEAWFIASEIKRIIAYSGGMLNFNDFAVLLRFNALSRTIEAEFQAQGITSRMMGGHKFFDRMEVKDLLAYLALADNPGFTPAFLRVVNTPKRGIGDKTVADLVAKAASLRLKPMEMAEQVVSGEKTVAGIKPATKKGLADLVSVVVTIRKLANQKKPVSQLIEVLIKKIDFQTWLKREPDFDSRWENVKELISFSTMLENNDGKLAEAMSEFEDRQQQRRDQEGEFVDPDLDDNESNLTTTPSMKAPSQSSQGRKRPLKREQTDVIDLSISSDEDDKQANAQPVSKKRPRTAKRNFGEAMLDHSDTPASAVKKQDPDRRKSPTLARTAARGEEQSDDEAEEADAGDSDEKTPLRVFLEASILATDATEAEDEDGKPTPKVTISTCHSAKGLEWPVVFVPAVEAGTYPAFRCQAQHEIDEECRLLYVAMTRAEALLYLTYSSQRVIGGETQDKVLSDFIGSIAERKHGGSASEAKAVKFCVTRPQLGADTVDAIVKVTGRPKPEPGILEESVKKFEASDVHKSITANDYVERERATRENSYGRSSVGWATRGGAGPASLGRFSGGGSFAPTSSLGALSNDNLRRTGSFPSSASGVSNNTMVARQNLGFSRPTIGSFSTSLDDYGSTGPDSATGTAWGPPNGTPGKGTRTKRPLMPPSMQAKQSAETSSGALKPPPPPRFTDEVRLRARPEDAIEVASGRTDGMAPRRRADLESFQKANDMSINDILDMIPPSLAGSTAEVPHDLTSGEGTLSSNNSTRKDTTSSNSHSRSAGPGQRRLGMGMARRGVSSSTRGKTNSASSTSSTRGRPGTKR